MVLWCHNQYVDCVQARNWAPTLSWRFSQMLGIPAYHGCRMPSQSHASQLLYKLHFAQEAVSHRVAGGGVSQPRHMLYLRTGHDDRECERERWIQN